MSLRGQVAALKQRLGVRDGCCPRCGCPADVTRVLWICPIGVPFPPEERQRQLERLPKCPRCGKPLGVHVLGPGRDPLPEPSPATPAVAGGGHLDDAELNAAIAVEVAKLEANWPTPGGQPS